MVLAITPVTNPTSTVLYKAIVAAKTRNAVHLPARRRTRSGCCRAQRRDPARGGRGGRDARGRPAGRAGRRPRGDPLPVQALRTSTSSGSPAGPKIVALANAAGKPSLSVGPGNAPIYVHRTADIRGAVVDILISKTFDASVICPAEQTCIVDDAVYDEMVAELERMGARVLTPEEADRLAEFAFGCGDHGQPGCPGPAGHRAGPAGRHRGRARHQGAARARCPADLDRARRAPAGPGEADAGPRPGACRVGRARDRRRRPGHRARRAGPHLGDLRPRRRGHRRATPGRPHRPHPGQRADGRGCARRHLQQPDADLLPRLRHLGRVDHHRERQLHAAAQHQDRLPPPDAAAVVPGARRTRTSTPARSRTCATSRARSCVVVTDADTERARRGRPGPGQAARPSTSTSSARWSPSPTRR